MESEEERLRAERLETYEQQREQDRIAREERLLSGADCKWTQLRKSRHWYCRANGACDNHHAFFEKQRLVPAFAPGTGE